MKNITEINLNLTKQDDHTLQNKIPPVVKSIVDNLFDQLAFVFPAWKYTWDTEEKIKGAKKEWVKAFYENDIKTKEQIAHGLKKARKMDSDFLPSCGKFVSWCNPTPEDLGYPAKEKALMLCVSHRSKTKLGLETFTRPLIIELCKRVDWFLMNSAGTQAEHKKADTHFNDIYMELINSGYQEPVETQSERLETSKVVNDRMTPEQQESKKQRHLDTLKGIRKNLAKVKANKLIK
jgi:hypothetical protein